MRCWSRVASVLFTLLCVPCANAIELDAIPADRPWFIFRAPDPDSVDALAYADQLTAGWAALDEPLRARAALEIPGPRTGQIGWGDRFNDVVNELQVDGVATVVAITDSRRTLFPLDELRSMFDRFTSIAAVHVAGLQFSEYPALASGEPLAVPVHVRWLASVIELAADYGRRVVIEMDGLEWVHLTANTWNEPLLESMRSHPAVVVPLNAQLGPHTTVAASAIMGLWIENAAAQWGVACNPAWFSQSRFVGPGVFGPSSAPMPPALYRAMILNGAMAGATVYRFPASGDLWLNPESAPWSEAIAPTLDEIAGRGYIARKDLVLGKINVAFRLNPATTLAEFDANLPDLDPLFRAGSMLHGAYGLELPGQVPELILNNGAFYWIPILSPFADDAALQHFKEVVMPGSLRDAREWRDRLVTHYVADGGGTAFITRIGRAYFIMQSRENFYEEQPFTLAAVPAPVRGATASRTPDGVEISWPFREGDVFYRVYRRTLPSTRWVQVSPDLDALSFKDTSTPGGTETVAYAVTSLTNETEPYEGTVNYGDYLVVNTVESRVVEEMVFEPDTQASASMPLPPDVDGRPASQQWWPDYGDIEGERLLIAQSIVAQVESLEFAYRTADLAGVLAVYDPDYADPDSWGLEYVRTAWDLFFKRFRPGPMHRQVRAWDFSTLATQERVSLRLYCRLTAQPLSPPDAESPPNAIEFPASPDGEVTLSFHRVDDRWLLVESNPPLPRIDDWLPPLAAR